MCPATLLLPRLAPAVLDAMAEAATWAGHAASLHRQARPGRLLLHRTVTRLRQLFLAPAAEVALTSGGGEALRLGLWGLARARRHACGARVVWLAPLTSPSLEAAARALQAEGFALKILSPAAVAEPSQLSWPAAGPAPALLALALAEPRTGGCLDPRPLCAWAAAHGVPLLIDALQAAAEGPVPGAADACVALSGPHMGGPAASGALLVPPGQRLMPLWGGGEAPGGLRPGTPALVPLAGLEAALAALPSRWARVPAARQAQARLQAQIQRLPGAWVHDPGAPRLAKRLLVGFEGISGTALAAARPSTGVPCGEPHLLWEQVDDAIWQALGLTAARRREALRLTGPEEWNDDDFIRHEHAILAGLAASAAAVRT